MNQLPVIGLVLIALFTTIFSFPATASSATFEAGSSLTPYRQAWSDDFDASALDDRWTWVREDESLWSLTNSPGNMQITSSGSLYQTSNDQKNLLLTPAPDGNYRITARVQTSPTENYHGAALYVYQDDDNFIEAIRIYNDGPCVALRAEIAGVRWGSYVSVTQDDILLRMVKEEDAYYGWFSEDNGATWNFIYQFSASFSDPQVGLGVEMGPTLTPLTADFDWIDVEKIRYNTAWEDSFDLPDLDQRWYWVREDPSLWSLAASPGSMRIISAGSIYQTNANDQANLLLTNAPAGDFEITAGVLVSPIENYHGATLYVYQDDDNYIEISRAYRDGPVFGFRVEKAGVASTTYAPASETAVRLRIVKEGDTYYGWYSEDGGVTWDYIGQYTLALNQPQVGISARLGPTTTPVMADWLYFQSNSYLEQIFLAILLK